jgi:hypothetical protein
VRVFQLQAKGIESFCGSKEITIYNTILFATYDMAEKRVEKFRVAVADRIDNPKITIVPMEVVSDEMNTLPESHVPSVFGPPQIESRNEVVYACGYEYAPGSYGMYNGPTPVLLDLLESVPIMETLDSKPCIIRFNMDGTDEVLYRWDDPNHTWILQGAQRGNS